MRSRDYRRLRQVELIRFAMAKFGRAHWKVRLAAEIGMHKNETARWLLEDWNGRRQDRIELWAERAGFQSIYATELAPFRFHALLLNQILDKAFARRGALPDAQRLSNSILPFNEEELDQAIAALGFDLINHG